MDDAAETVDGLGRTWPDRRRHTTSDVRRDRPALLPNGRKPSISDNENHSLADTAAVCDHGADGSRDGRSRVQRPCDGKRTNGHANGRRDARQRFARNRNGMPRRLRGRTVSVLRAARKRASSGGPGSGVGQLKNGGRQRPVNGSRPSLEHGKIKMVTTSFGETPSSGYVSKNSNENRVNKTN